MSTDIRALYLSTANTAVQLIADPAVSAAWDSPSALAEFSVRGLAGHLAQQIFAVRSLLDDPTPGTDPIPVIEHYRRAAWRADTDPKHPVNAQVRDRGELIAEDGQPALAQAAGAAARALTAALAQESPHRLVHLPWTGWSLTLNDFLTTRLLELVVHSDDLATSANTPTPPLDPAAHRVVLALLLELSTERHGPTAVLRALSRTERAPTTISAM